MSKSVHVCQSYSKPKVGRFMRHGVVYSARKISRVSVVIELIESRSCRLTTLITLDTRILAYCDTSSLLSIA